MVDTLTPDCLKQKHHGGVSRSKMELWGLFLTLQSSSKDTSLLNFHPSGGVNDYFGLDK